MEKNSQLWKISFKNCDRGFAGCGFCRHDFELRTKFCKLSPRQVVSFRARFYQTEAVAVEVAFDDPT